MQEQIITLALPHVFAYEPPTVYIVKLDEDIITSSPTYDPDQGEWDVEGD